MSTQTDIKPKRMVEQAGSLRIAGLSTTYIFGKNTLNAPALWQEFGIMAPNIPAKNEKIAYGLCFDIDGDKGIEYVCGLEIPENVNKSDLPEKMIIKILPDVTYAVFEHEGHVSGIRQTCDDIWKSWFPQSGYKKPDQADFFFERYGENFDPQKGTGDIEIWIPVSK